MLEVKPVLNFIFAVTATQIIDYVAGILCALAAILVGFMYFKYSLKAYLYTIAHHLCIDENRKYRTSELNENFPIEDQQLRQVEDRDQINSLLNLLTPSQKEAILLHYGEQLSFREISQILDIPARTVQSRVRAALSVLRKENL